MRLLAALLPKTRPLAVPLTPPISPISVRAMSTGTQPNSSAPQKPKGQASKKEVKILMLHGKFCTHENARAYLLLSPLASFSCEISC